MPHLHLVAAGRRRPDPEAHEAPPSARRCDRASAPRCARLRPDIVFGADLIAGFPTETEAMFANTLRAGRGVRPHLPARLPLSPRAVGTPAARMPQLPGPVRKERAARLRAAGAARARRAISPAGSARRRACWSSAARPARRSATATISRRCASPGSAPPARIVDARVTGATDEHLIAARMTLEPFGRATKARLVPAPEGRAGRTSTKITDSITGIFTKRKLDRALLDELEEALIAADLGPATAARLIAGAGQGPLRQGGHRATRCASIFADEIAAHPGAGGAAADARARRKPHVVLVVGVNGSGKTTTIGKLAQSLQAAPARR